MWWVLKLKYLFNGYGLIEMVVMLLLWKVWVGDVCGVVYMLIGMLLGNCSGYIFDG